MSAETGIPLDKLKLLYNKKPVSDSKTLKDVLGPDGEGAGAGAKGVEFSVMVMGGAATLAAAAAKKAAESSEGGGEKTDESGVVAQGLSGEGVLATEEFWDDLKGFLQQRVRDEKVAGEATEAFRGAWKGRT